MAGYAVTIVIHPDDSNVLDLYNVDYVCKVAFVDREFRIEKLEEVADVKERGE